MIYKSGSGKSKVSNERVGKTHTPASKMPGKGGGNTKRDSATATGTSSGGSTMKYRSGDVKRSVGSFAKYK